MKRPFLIFTAAVCAVASFAQQPGPDAASGGDSTFVERFERMILERGDPLPAVDIYLPDLPDMDGYRPRRVVPMSSVLVAPQLPGHVVVTDGFRLGRAWSLVISNGKAMNWGTTPGSYLDARTLSFPVPR